jgi:hypothetical protein
MTKQLGILTVALLVALGGCATAGTGGGGGGDAVLTRDDIESVDVGNLYDVVQRLRPRWLQVRADRSLTGETAVVVFQNRTYLGGIEVLRDFGREAVESLRYMDGPRASASLPGLGGRAVEGAIIIQTGND